MNQNKRSSLLNKRRILQGKYRKNSECLINQDASQLQVQIASSKIFQKNKKYFSVPSSPKQPQKPSVKPNKKAG